MPIFEIEANGQVFEVEAPDMKKAVPIARLFVARQRMTDAATAGAMARSNAPAAGGDESYPRLSLVRPEHFNPSTPEGALNLGMASAAGVAGMGGPVAAAKGLALGTAGASAGGFAGKTFGQGLEYMGAPEGTSGVAGTIGGLVGGLAGPMGGPKVIGRILQSGGGKTGMIGRLLGGAESSPEALAIAAKKLELETAKLAEKQAAREATTAYRARMAQNAEERIALMKARLEGKAAKAAATAPKSPAKATEAASAAPTPRQAVPVAPTPDTAQIVLQLQQQMGTAAGRKVVRELLQQMPKAQASQIRLLLARGQEHPATVAGALFNPQAPARTAGKPGEELARMLGQIQ